MDRKAVSLVLILLVPAGLAAADKNRPLPQPIVKAIDAATKPSKERIKEAESDVRRAAQALARDKRGAIRPGSRGVSVSDSDVSFPSKESKLETIARAQKTLEDAKAVVARLKTGEQVDYPLIELPAKVGAAGTILGEEGHLLQVVSSKEAIVELSFVKQGPITRQPGVSMREAAEARTAHATVMFRGIDTSGLSDGTRIELPGLYEVTSNERYQTVGGGSNTVLVFEPIDDKAVEQYRSAKKKQK